MPSPNCEVLRTTARYSLRRCGRYLIAELMEEHLVLSTSICNGGQRRGLRYLGNHQSREATMHTERQAAIKALGQETYHDFACREAGLPPTEVALMGTAANMNYAAIATEEDRGVEVTAVVTAGVQGNAACAGDPDGWRERTSSHRNSERRSPAPLHRWAGNPQVGNWRYRCHDRCLRTVKLIHYRQRQHPI